MAAGGLAWASRLAMLFVILVNFYQIGSSPKKGPMGEADVSDGAEGTWR